jgi:gas vesicle protein
MTSTDEVRRDIERVRGDLGQTLEELSDRVAPAKVVARTKETVVEKVEEVKDKVNPARVAKRERDKLRNGFRNVMGFSDNSAAGGDALGQRSDIAGRAGDAARSALGTAQDAPHVARQRAEGNPLAAGLLTFAAGFLLASVLPPTERERQLTERLREGIQPLAEEAAETGKQIAQELGQSAQQSLEQVKKAATGATERVKREAEGKVDALKEEASSAANDVKDEATDAVEDIRGKAQETASTVAGEAKDATDGPAIAIPTDAAPLVAPARRPRPLRAPGREPTVYGNR